MGDLVDRPAGMLASNRVGQYAPAAPFGFLDATDCPGKQPEQPPGALEGRVGHASGSEGGSAVESQPVPVPGHLVETVRNGIRETAVVVEPATLHGAFPLDPKAAMRIGDESPPSQLAERQSVDRKRQDQPLRVTGPLPAVVPAA